MVREYRKLRVDRSIPLENGLVVWACVDGHPWWPARILDRQTAEASLDPGFHLEEQSEDSLTVQFFDDDGMLLSVVNKRYICEYCSNMHLVRQTGRPRNDVIQACKDANEYIETKVNGPQMHRYSDMEPFDEFIKPRTVKSAQNSSSKLDIGSEDEHATRPGAGSTKRVKGRRKSDPAGSKSKHVDEQDLEAPKPNRAELSRGNRKREVKSESVRAKKEEEVLIPERDISELEVDMKHRRQRDDSDDLSEKPNRSTETRGLVQEHDIETPSGVRNGARGNQSFSRKRDVDTAQSALTPLRPGDGRIPRKHDPESSAVSRKSSKPRDSDSMYHSRMREPGGRGDDNRRSPSDGPPRKRRKSKAQAEHDDGNDTEMVHNPRKSKSKSKDSVRNSKREHDSELRAGSKSSPARYENERTRKHPNDTYTSGGSEKDFEYGDYRFNRDALSSFGAPNGETRAFNSDSESDGSDDFIDVNGVEESVARDETKVDNLVMEEKFDVDAGANLNKSLPTTLDEFDAKLRKAQVKSVELNDSILEIGYLRAELLNKMEEAKQKRIEATQCWADVMAANPSPKILTLTYAKDRMVPFIDNIEERTPILVKDMKLLVKKWSNSLNQPCPYEIREERVGTPVKRFRSSELPPIEKQSVVKSESKIEDTEMNEVGNREEEGRKGKPIDVLSRSSAVDDVGDTESTITVRNHVENSMKRRPNSPTRESLSSIVKGKPEMVQEKKNDTESIRHRLTNEGATAKSRVSMGRIKEERVDEVEEKPQAEGVIPTSAESIKSSSSNRSAARAKSFKREQGLKSLRLLLSRVIPESDARFDQMVHMIEGEIATRSMKSEDEDAYYKIFVKAVRALKRHGKELTEKVDKMWEIKSAAPLFIS